MLADPVSVSTLALRLNPVCEGRRAVSSPHHPRGRSMNPAYALSDLPSVFSPSLVFFPELIRQNISRVIEMAGTPDRLRPHVKTHKTREIVKLLLDAGVTKHKCATIAEAEMLATAGAPDVLIAYPLVGPNLARLAALIRKFPGTAFSCLIDHPEPTRALS